jgi:hypothetical protein
METRLLQAHRLLPNSPQVHGNSATSSASSATEQPTSPWRLGYFKRIVCYRIAHKSMETRLLQSLSRLRPPLLRPSRVPPAASPQAAAAPPISRAASSITATRQHSLPFCCLHSGSTPSPSNQGPLQVSLQAVYLDLSWTLSKRFILHSKAPRFDLHRPLPPGPARRAAACHSLGVISEPSYVSTSSPHPSRRIRVLE